MKHVLGAILLCATLAYSQGDVSLAVQLADPSGKAWTGARVILLDEPDPPAIPQNLQYRAVVDEKGVALFSSIPSGKYRVCAGGGGTRMLNPCVWDRRGVYVTTPSPNAKQAAIKLVFEEGAIVKVSIDDQADILANNLGKDSAKILLMEIWNEAVGRSPVLPSSASKAKQKDYEVLVPKGYSYKVRVMSPGFAVEDIVAKRRVDLPDRDIDVEVKADAAEATIQLAATDVKAVESIK